MRKRTWLRFDDYLEKRLADPAFRAAYEAQEKDLAVIKALLEFRKQQAVTQEELAQRSGMRQSAIARFETVGSNPTIKSLFRLADALNARLEIKFVPKG
jgi:DNA-binding XRE family transcriptional regulator